MLINVFINSIYLYDNDFNDKFKMFIVCNASTVPVEITADILNTIETSNQKAECSFFNPQAPPNKVTGFDTM